ncbi:MAG TPA: hypothetical protein DHV51_00440 [Opitutae bacterium]|nr:hypothetical protein [Opitutae bacterium]
MVRETHPSYNEAIANTLNEQLLVNIVRMRYRDNPCFLDIESITSTYEMSTNVGFNASVPEGDSNTYTFPGFSLSVSDKPTVTYKPLEGTSFITKMLRHMQQPIVVHLMQSGWNADRVLMLCVERVNDVFNFPEASGPTPAMAPDCQKFKRAVEILRDFQKQHMMSVGLQSNVNFPKQALEFYPSDATQGELKEFKSILGLSPDLNQFKIDTDFLDRSPKTLTFRFRSVLGMLFYMSQTVEVPKADVEKGLVNVTKNADGTPFDWNQLIGQYFKVKVSDSKPDNAFARVYYRGHWFYVADNDLDSKTTFLFMTQLFSLQSGDVKDASPILTIPVR